MVQVALIPLPMLFLLFHNSVDSTAPNDLLEQHLASEHSRPGQNSSVCKRFIGRERDKVSAEREGGKREEGKREEEEAEKKAERRREREEERGGAFR